MNNKFGKDEEGSGRGLMEWIVPAFTCRDWVEPLGNITDVSAEISNGAPPEYKSEAVPLEPHCSATFYYCKYDSKHKQHMQYLRFLQTLHKEHTSLEL
jgi:hypothetical protein